MSIDHLQTCFHLLSIEGIMKTALARQPSPVEICAFYFLQLLEM